MTKPVLVFGGSGKTGVHVLKKLLGDGKPVRAFLQSPKSFTLRHENLEVFAGDMTCEKDVHMACIGVSQVICVAGGPVYKWSRYPFGLMGAFAGYLIDGMRKASVKRVVYQAGRVNPLPWREGKAFKQDLEDCTWPFYRYQGQRARQRCSHRPTGGSEGSELDRNSTQLHDGRVSFDATVDLLCQSVAAPSQLHFEFRRRGILDCRRNAG